jgi:hypothetical protein
MRHKTILFDSNVMLPSPKFESQQIFHNELSQSIQPKNIYNELSQQPAALPAASRQIIHDELSQSIQLTNYPQQALPAAKESSRSTTTQECPVAQAETPGCGTVKEIF